MWVTIFLILLVLVVTGGFAFAWVWNREKVQRLEMKLERREQKIAYLQKQVKQKDADLQAAYTSLELLLLEESKQVQDMNKVLEMVLDGA